MTTPSTPSKSRRRKGGGGRGGNGFLDTGFGGPEMNARVFLLIACLWPLWVMALFGASSAGRQLSTENNSNNNSPGAGAVVSQQQEQQQKGAFNLRSVLDRVDVLGYGPTHPRVAIVIVGGGEDGGSRQDVLTSVESIYRNTDLNRIFLIMAIMDDAGPKKDEKLEQELAKIDAGSVPHWHGLRPDIHLGGSSNSEGEETHGRKIHAIFHDDKQGTAASRQEAVEFIQLLEQKHEQAGLKSPEEDLILVFLQPGSQLVDRKWLKSVTHALIVPPPILRDASDVGIANKLANAVSFHPQGLTTGKRTSFGEKLAPFTSEATAEEMGLSSGDSYPSPAFHGSAMAMRLDTFRSFPAQDPSLEDPWAANLDLAMNLWLCGDGIDVMIEAEVIALDEIPDHVPGLEPEVAARFAAVWMEEPMRQRFFQAYSDQITRLEWETKVTLAQKEPDFPRDINKKCRSFEWYVKEVNPNLSKILEQLAWDDPKHKNHQLPPPKPQVIKPQVESKKEEPEVKAPPKKEAEKAPPPHEAAKEEKEAPKKVGEAKEKEEAPKKVVLEEHPHDEHHEPPDMEEGLDHHEPPPENNGDEVRVLNKKKKLPFPLRKENLEIIQKATPIDISYVDVSGGHKEHPHMGAKDEDGNYGYIHDETALHNNPPGFSWKDKEQEKQACTTRDNHYRMMTERVVVDVDYEKEMNEKGVKRDKIFCLVYTIESGHVKIPNIRETWGPKCDGFMVGSTKTDRSIGAVEIDHEGEEEYNNIWQKVRSMWSYIYDNYYEKYDWFHIGGDDLFLLVENLREYLESDEIRTAANGGLDLPDGNETMQTPLLLGRRFAYQGKMDEIFDSGGSGYTMNKAALKALVVDGFPNYFPHAHTFSEDTMVARIFRKMGVFPYDTKDDDGGERYMPFMPGHHWGYRLPKDKTKDWYAMYSINIKEGPEHCSPQSVAFHYVKDDNMKRLFAWAYGLCPSEYAVQK